MSESGMEKLAAVWAIRFSLGLLAVVIASRFLRWDQMRPVAWRAAWTLGLSAAWMHALLVFHEFYKWSHTAAYEDTAIRTQQQVGISFGGGLFFNYVFLLLWTADVAWWWWSRRTFDARSPYVTRTVDAYLLFIAVNGAVVFADGAMRWISFGLLLGLGLAVLIVLIRRSQSNAP